MNGEGTGATDLRLKPFMKDTPQPADPAPTANPWTRLSRDLAYENPWIKVYHDRVLRPDGRPGIYGVVHYRNRAVGAVVLDEQDRVLLVGQYRYTLDVYSWEIPEGGAPAGEDLLRAAQRELLEETGYTAGGWQELVRVHLSNSVSDEEAVIFLARDPRPGDARPEPTELLQVKWVPFETTLHMTYHGQITDAMSVLGLQRLALLRLDPGSAR
jgi:8-oxo-dGTP pyrophosphatase MutT (NUDIX family)